MNERFIARHMMIERIRPDDPSSAPAMMSSLFCSTNPIATADSPAYEFNSEMTVGMSAPPIGMISSTPKMSDSTTMAAYAGQYVLLTKARYNPATTAINSSSRLTTF